MPQKIRNHDSPCHCSYQKELPAPTHGRQQRQEKPLERPFDPIYQRLENKRFPDPQIPTRELIWETHRAQPRACRQGSRAWPGLGPSRQASPAPGGQLVEHGACGAAASDGAAARQPSHPHTSYRCRVKFCYCSKCFYVSRILDTYF